MSINHIEATKFFDEVRAHFARQTHAGKAIELVVRAGLNSDGAIFVGYFDTNNPRSVPLELMTNETATGIHWENQIGSGVVFKVVNEALLAFDKKKKEWVSIKYDFSVVDSVNFLMNFMKQVSSYLR